MKKIVLFFSIILAGGLLFTNSYNSVIDVKSWGADIPQSIETARAYFSTINPGNFFRVLSPINQLLALVSLLIFWKSSVHVRIFLGISLLLYVLVDVFTFAYFYPRNEILFIDKPLASVTELKLAWSQWKTMNWIRNLMLLTGVILSSISLHRIYIKGKV